MPVAPELAPAPPPAPAPAPVTSPTPAPADGGGGWAATGFGPSVLGLSGSMPPRERVLTAVPTSASATRRQDKGSRKKISFSVVSLATRPGLGHHSVRTDDGGPHLCAQLPPPNAYPAPLDNTCPHPRHNSFPPTLKLGTPCATVKLMECDILVRSLTAPGLGGEPLLPSPLRSSPTWDASPAMLPRGEDMTANNTRPRHIRHTRSAGVPLNDSPHEPNGG